MEGKIIGIGFHKTGTSTLRESLSILGYRVKDATPRALIPILRGNYEKIKRILQNYDAMEDTPWFWIYQELDRLYPGSKFILTERDEESWYRSVSNHIGSLRAAHHEWIYGKGKGLPKDNEEHALAVYRKHNAEVRDYFSSRPEDLLIIDFTNGDEWEKLCEFLDEPVPELPFPHYNKTSEVNKRKGTMKSKMRFYRQAFKNRLKMKYIELLGLEGGYANTETSR